MSARGASTTRKRGATKSEQKAAANATALKTASGKAAHSTKALARLTSSRARNPHAFQARTSLAGLTKPAEEALRARLADLLNSKTQRALVLDAKTGDVLVDRAGKTASSVSLSFRPSAEHPGARGERDAASGNVYVRSQPTNQTPTFSLAQYEELRSRLNPSAAVVVSRDSMVTLSPTKNGWPPYATVKAALDRAYAANLDALNTLASRASTSKTVLGAIRRMTAADLAHLAWRQAARETGMRYTRTAYTTRAHYEMNLDERVFSSIRSGAKTQEGRLGSGYNRSVRVGDIIHFTGKDGSRLSAEVTSTKRYATLDQMIRGAGLGRLGFNYRGATTQQAKDDYQRFFWYADPKKSRTATSDWEHTGWIAFGVRPVTRDTAYTSASAASTHKRK